MQYLAATLGSEAVRFNGVGLLFVCFFVLVGWALRLSMIRRRT